MNNTQPDKDLTDWFSSVTPIQSVFILIQISQYGPHGTQFKEVVGVYQSRDSLDQQIKYYEEHHPSTSDIPYHFEVLTCPVDFVGEVNQHMQVSKRG